MQAKYDEAVKEINRLKHEKTISDLRGTLVPHVGEEAATSIAAIIPSDLSDKHTELFKDLSHRIIQASASKHAGGGFREPVAPFMSSPLGEKRKATEEAHAPVSRERAYIDSCMRAISSGKTV
jgi:hypothetical protein